MSKNRLVFLWALGAALCPRAARAQDVPPAAVEAAPAPPAAEAPVPPQVNPLAEELHRRALALEQRASATRAQRMTSWCNLAAVSERNPYLADADRRCREMTEAARLKDLRKAFLAEDYQVLQTQLDNPRLTSQARVAALDEFLAAHAAEAGHWRVREAQRARDALQAGQEARLPDEAGGRRKPAHAAAFPTWVAPLAAAACAAPACLGVPLFSPLVGTAGVALVSGLAAALTLGAVSGATPVALSGLLTVAVSGLSVLLHAALGLPWVAFSGSMGWLLGIVAGKKRVPLLPILRDVALLELGTNAASLVVFLGATAVGASLLTAGMAAHHVQQMVLGSNRLFAAASAPLSPLVAVPALVWGVLGLGGVAAFLAALGTTHLVTPILATLGVARRGRPRTEDEDWFNLDWGAVPDLPVPAPEAPAQEGK